MYPTWKRTETENESVPALRGCLKSILESWVHFRYKFPDRAIAAEFKNGDGYNNHNWSRWTLQALTSALSLLFFLLSGHCDAEQVERDKHDGAQENPLKDLHTFFIMQCKRRPQQTHSQHPKPYHATQTQQHWHGVARWCHFTSISIMHNILPVNGSVIL